MEQRVRIQEVRKTTDIFLDTFYAYFDPIRGFFRSFVERQYRVSYTYDGGMTLLSDTKTFTAMHDRQARRLARQIAGSDRFKLEQYRPVNDL